MEFTKEDLEYIESIKFIRRNVYKEWEQYKKVIPKPFAYTKYLLLSKTKAMEEIIETKRQSFSRWGWRSTIDNRSINYIKLCYERRCSWDWAKQAAKTLWISIITVYNYCK